MSDASYVPDDHTYQSLHKEIDNGIHLLRKLSGLEKTHDVGKSQRLPVQELEQAAGLAIFEASKLGLVITGVSGRGFLIKKVGGGWVVALDSAYISVCLACSLIPNVASMFENY